MSILQVKDLEGGYSKIPVLKKISFNVKAGELVGLIGLNGAGKSTTINHIIGLLIPQKGTIRVDGVTLFENSEKYKKSIAYVPETPILYEELTLKEHIDLTIQAYNLPQKETWNKADKILEIFRLNKKLTWFPNNFSKGMKQKVMLVCAFITDAKLLIIDEPFLGLDPLATRDLLKLVEDFKNKGGAVLMSTHVLSTAQEYCDRFVLINNGEIRASGDLNSLRALNNDVDSSLADIYLKLAEEN